MDDYYYFYSFANGKRITGIIDILESQYAHYFNMNGRSVLHFLVQLFLFLPRPFFVIMNSLAYVFLGFLIYAHVMYGKEKSFLMFFLIFMGMWFLIPDFGSTVLWTDGACNYMWGTMIILGFLLPYRMYLENQNVLRSKMHIVLMLLFGIIAGWCNENVSGAAWLCILLFMVLYKVKKVRIPLWSVSGLAGCLVGFAFMILAPGNWHRIHSFEYEAEGSFWRHLLSRYVIITEDISSGIHGWILVLMLFLLVYLVFKFKNVSVILEPAIYIIGSLGGAYAMLLSPYIPERVMFGPVCFGLIGLGMLFEKMKLKLSLPFIAGVGACLLTMFLIHYSYVAIDNVIVWRAYQHREEYICNEKEKGNYDIEVDYIPARGHRCPWLDISVDSNDSINRGTADRYGLNSIRVMSEK